MNVLIIANPIAGGGKGEFTANQLARELRSRGADTHTVITRAQGDARSAAAAHGYDCVASVGGDGTANEVVNGFTGTAVPLAILPLGTANVVAREYGLSRDPAVLAERIVSGKRRVLDLGSANGHRFLMGAGAGFDAAVVNVIHAHRGKKLGLLAWILPTLKTAFTFEPAPIRVVVDGMEIESNAGYVIIGNCRYTAGIIPFTPAAVTDDGLLDVCIIREPRPLRLAWLALRAFFPGFTSLRSITYIKGAVVELSSASNSPVPMQVDGDPAGYLPARFEAISRALTLVGIGD
ncbi:MAG: hypothetical protein AMXMBFR84_06570 [Candidatus Hydrogenedentota bacterium]